MRVGPCGWWPRKRSNASWSPGQDARQFGSCCKNTTFSRGGKKMWCIAELDDEYIKAMEDVLEVYERPLSAEEPVVCVDEKPVNSTYFEGEMQQNPKAKRGYSRDKRPDCLQLVIALVVTTDGLPLAYEVMKGNTSDRTTLPGFLKKIEDTYGKARRVWVMDRGVPSEAILKDMRSPERQTFYLVGTPKSKINQHEKKWLDLPWQKVRDSVDVKLYEHEGELYVLARSGGRQAKENAMRRKRLARLLRKLRAMRKSLPKRDQLLLRIGAA